MKQRTHWGVTIGILMVETKFRRFVGDIGNAETWPFPVQYRVVHGATPDNITRLQGGALLAPFREAMLALVTDGVDGITTTCGFLSLYQRELAAACPVPVATSALLQAPMIGPLLAPGQRIGVLTYDADALTQPYLDAAGVSPGTPVIGMPREGLFVRAIREGLTDPDFALLEREVLDAAARLLARGNIGAILCECTNLTPFSAAIAEACGVPVWDAVTLVTWFHGGLRPCRYPPR